jgi:trehalose-phosphatase
MKRPRPLWRHWRSLVRHLRNETDRGLALLSDFDGTLAPIVPHPDQARLPARARRALERWARLPSATVGVVSGRSLADLRRRVGLRGIHYIGSHGEEWTGANGRAPTRANARCVACIRALGAQLEERLASLPGICVERKTMSVAVHYRQAGPRAATAARRAVLEALRTTRRDVRLLEGKKVLELLPAGSGSKGHAVTRLRAQWAPRRPLIYLGDDVTDESVFRRLRRGDIGIHVGENSRSWADYRVRSPEGAARFLERLAEVLK